MRSLHPGFFLLPILLFGCRQQPSGRVIARVGSAELTLDEAKAHIDTTRAALDYALNDYASYWVNTELLYQEAKRQGVENSPEFIRQLEEVRRQLANQTYLEHFVYSDTAGLNPRALNSRDLENSFSASVTKGSACPAAVEHLLHDSSAASSVLASTHAQYYTMQTLFPPELWKVASALSVNEVSFPVKTAGGYFVLQCLARYDQGS